MRPVAMTNMNPPSLLDEFAPARQFGEFHTVRVRAAADKVYRAIKDVTAAEITFFRTLTWIRRFGRPGPESILNAPAREPLLEVATRTGFLLLADDSHRELVLGTVVIAPEGAQRPATPDQFKLLAGPGFAKATINFRLEDEGETCLLSTETRVQATDARSRRRFAMYWFAIYPGSAFIRRMWLRAIKRRAERPEGRVSRPGRL
ncbi:MAG: hypothetical protein E6J78_13590 [Deltaproteobacteria bacterium]|nr:MAG: hypothetical protein E6J78_13590 [Deltaproteobacteria bacterium]